MKLGSSNVAVLTALIVCKQVLDLYLHLRERQCIAAKPRSTVAVIEDADLPASK